MDTQSTPVDRFMETLSEVLRLRLYVVILAVQAMIAAPARWCLGIMAWTVLGWIVHTPLTPGPIEAVLGGLVDPFSPGFIAFLFAVGPLVWSAAAFWRPGTGRIWIERIGGDHPSEGETRRIDAAFESLGQAATWPLRKLYIYVIDTNDKFAFARGHACAISRGLIEDGPLEAVLAHEVNHLRSIDGRFIQALDRLVLFGDPLVRTRDEDAVREFGAHTALLLGCFRWLLRLAGGSLALRLMSPSLARHWRKRERAADENAVALGQGPALAQFLKAWELPKERPNPRLLFNLRQYERVSHRIDVLESAPAHP